jgi:CrcB protein
MIYIMVGLGGVIGALLRYYLGLVIFTWWMSPFPLPTLIANLTGSFVLGWLTRRASDWKIHPYLFTGLGTGLIGSFTTFSSLSAETVALLNGNMSGMAIVYVLLSLFGGLLMSWFGLKGGNRFVD